LRGKEGRQYFLKLNEAKLHAMFVAEAVGLREIQATHSLRVPQPIVEGKTETHCFLVLEYLELRSRGNAALLGTQLAALHRCEANQFGFSQDNFIGSTLQPNRWTDDWVTFWREQRLGFQLRLAAEKGYGGKLQELGADLLRIVPVFFTDYTPRPSLLHGDLWGGNHAYLSYNTPVIFDPAVYYGDRECDIAMTELFGGYSTDFYAAYRNAYPLNAGYAERHELYNLYHILNHANLFGGAYVKQAEAMMQGLLARAG
jgi:fructosamine-3-kinase